nr:membrane lipoprotein lipid attachment site-containing protein [Elizabethkingia bruuniana]
MKKYLFLISATVLLAGCDAMNYGTYNRFPRYPSYPGNNNTSMANTEREYNELLKTYKPETEAVLNDLLNSTDPNAINTSIVIKMNLPVIWFSPSAEVMVLKEYQLVPERLAML